MIKKSVYAKCQDSRAELYLCDLMGLYRKVLVAGAASYAKYTPVSKNLIRKCFPGSQLLSDNFHK